MCDIHYSKHHGYFHMNKRQSLTGSKQLIIFITDKIQLILIMCTVTRKPFVSVTGWKLNGILNNRLSFIFHCKKVSHFIEKTEKYQRKLS